MTFNVIFTEAAQNVADGHGDLGDLEGRTRDELAELPGEGLSGLEEQLFHVFALEDGTDVICSLTADGSVRVDACPVVES